MSVLLLVLGILVTGAGVVTIGFGIPNNEFSLGNTLIIAGTTALAAGLVLIGLAAAVGQLTRIAEALRSRPVARPPRPAEPALDLPAAEPPRPAPPLVAQPLPPVPELALREAGPPERMPVADSTLDVSASALERLRSSMSRGEAPAEPPPLPPGAPGTAARAAEPAPDSVPRAGVVVETLKKPRLDLLFRSKSTSAPAESFDTVWPRRAPQAPAAPGPEQPARRPSGNGVSPPGFAPPGAPGHAGEPRPAAILKSGVVDGMAYTLYADGSIEAQLPQGTVRFGSIAELRSHIENNS